MPFKVKGLNAEGETVEITVEGDALPEGLTTTEAATAQFEQTFQGRARRLKKQHRAEFLQDEEFQTAALQEWDVDVPALRAAAAKGEVGPEKIKELRTGWETEFLTPVVEERDGLRGTVTGMRTDRLESLILEEARRVGVKPEYLDRPTPTSKPMIVASMAGNYGWDDEGKGWFERNGEAYHFSANPEKYKTQLRGVGESFDAWVKTEAAKGYLTPQDQRGPGYTGPGTPPGSKDVAISYEASLDAQQFETAEAQANKLGGRVVVAPEE